MRSVVHQVDYASEGLVVGSPGRVAHVGTEKRKHTLRDRRPRDDGVDQDVRIARFGANPTSPEELLSHFEELPSETVLVDEELRLEVVAVASGGMSFDRHAHTPLAFHQTSQEPASRLLAR